MQALCSQCGAKFHLDDKKVAAHAKVQFKCSKCGHTTVVDVARHPDRTKATSPLPSFARSEGPANIEGTVISQYAGLVLPRDKVIALSVIAGPAKGLMHTMEKPRATLGRAGADIDLNDPEASRAHCVVEVKDDIVKLRDLDSTNGTFIADERVRAAELSHLSEFRVGSSLVLVTITQKSV